jgi:hypothetical protein
VFHSGARFDGIDTVAFELIASLSDCTAALIRLFGSVGEPGPVMKSMAMLQDEYRLTAERIWAIAVYSSASDAAP